MILSASEDSNITLIEVIQNYPTQEVFVDGARLQQTYQKISTLVNRLQS